MSEQTNPLKTLILACRKDNDLKERFVSTPTLVLAEFGIECDEDCEVRVLQNSNTLLHITIPKAPSNSKDLSDTTLESIAGGMASNLKTPGVNIYESSSESDGSEEGSTWPMPKFRF